MRDSDALRKIANALRAEADRRAAQQRTQSIRIVTAATGLTALHKLAGGRP